MEAVSHAVCSYCGSPSGGAKFCCNGCETLSDKFSRELPNQLEHLDQANFKNLYHSKSDSFDYQLYVKGIHCSSCVHLIEKLPSYDTEVEVARVDFGQSKLYLKVGANFSLAKALHILKSMGYEAQFLKTSEDIKPTQANENKMALKKLAVAGACVGNIMLFVIPVYSGLDGIWKTAFNWISFILFLPILFYSGTSFYKGAWISLRNRTINIDLPITVALLSGFILSTINLARGNGIIYFDSTASFIFLILCSRYFLKQTQQKYLASPRLEEVIGSDRFIRIKDGKETFVTLNEITKNDELKLLAGQINPVDGFSESTEALIDISILNGEPMPRHFEKGMVLQAGCRILSSEVMVKVANDALHSSLTSTLKQLEEGFWRKSRFINLTDRCAQILILTVFTIAILFFVLYFNYDPQEAFNRSLALIVLACPCALALGSPLAIALAVRKAQQKGILVKNSDALEKVLDLKNIFFDKTGTLTEFDLKLVSTTPALISENIKSVLLGVEQKSYHPIAFALRKIWSRTLPLPIEKINEIPSRGVTGYFNSDYYEFGQIGDQTANPFLRLVLRKNNQTVCSLSFENPIRSEAKKSIHELKEKGLTSFILSGDSQERVDLIAGQCHIPSHQALGNLTSENKRDMIKQYENTCMIGDGTNDALSLKVADVGIAIKGSTSINLQAADICFTRGGLEPLLDLFELAKQAKKVLVRNLTFSLFYNFIGGGLALSGFVSPWLAAILMPISSVLIIFSTLWGLK